MDYEAVVTFRVYHNEETPLNMSAGLLLFFGLHGSSAPHTVQDSFVLGENDIYIASPLTLYRVGCREGAALLSMMIAPEILRRAGWEDSCVADCFLSAERASDASHNAIRQGMAALFRSLFREENRVWYNFTYADLLFDFILSVGLHPYVELGFVPSKMAKVQYRLFERCSIAGTYADKQRWEALVQASVAHWIERYGLEEVLQWRFTILSYNYVQLPEIPMDDADYVDMYCTTYRILKELDAGLRLGGPGSFPSISLAEEGGKRLLMELTARGCPPDFLSVQMYPHENIERDAEFLRFTANQQSAPSVLSKDEDFVRNFLDLLTKRNLG